MSGDNLPYLLRLLDDDSPEIRSQIVQRLLAREEEVEAHLADPKADCTASPEVLRELLHALRSRQIRDRWPEWFIMPEGPEKLERAYGVLSEFVTPRWAGKSVEALLDHWAAEYIRRYSYPSVFQLARFLFEEHELAVSEENFYQPRNSDLRFLLEGGAGIPITLVAAFELVGRRLGLNIQGCAFPGRFLASTQVDQVTYVVDCFGEGRFVPLDGFIKAQDPALGDAAAMIAKTPDSEAHMTRVLNNLLRAYHELDDGVSCGLIGILAWELELHMKRRLEPDAAPPVFRTGQLVSHRKYGYRGVIVDYDLACVAGEDWYQSNRTRPDRDQSWYHVLVDGGSHTTYAAQSSLKLDSGGSVVRHPLLQHFFLRFHDRVYLRNGRCWPGN